MNQAAIRETTSGVIELSGVLDYLSGPTLRKQGADLIKSSSAAALVLDCSAVTKSSSVGLSLLLAFTRDAKTAGKQLVVRAMPKDMQEIAGVSGLSDVLPLQA